MLGLEPLYAPGSLHLLPGSVDDHQLGGAGAADHLRRANRNRVSDKLPAKHRSIRSALSHLPAWELHLVVVCEPNSPLVHSNGNIGDGGLAAVHRDHAGDCVVLLLLRPIRDGRGGSRSLVFVRIAPIATEAPGGLPFLVRVVICDHRGLRGSIRFLDAQRPAHATKT